MSRLYTGDIVDALLNLSFIAGLVAIGASIGIRVHGGMLVSRLCRSFARQFGECQTAIFLTNRISLMTALVGIVLLAIAFSPYIMAELDDNQEVTDGTTE